MVVDEIEVIKNPFWKSDVNGRNCEIQSTKSAAKYTSKLMIRCRKGAKKINAVFNFLYTKWSALKNIQVLNKFIRRKFLA